MEEEKELTLEQLQKIVALNKIYSKIFESGDFDVVISCDSMAKDKFNNLKEFEEGEIIESNLEAFIRRSGSLPYPGMHICGQKDDEEVANSYEIAPSLPYAEIEGRGRVIFVIDII